MDESSSPEGNVITLRIKFKSASLDEFVARYGADVSAGGIFIRTRQPLAVGSLLRFDFSLTDGSHLMAGMGTVVWIREPDPSRAGSIPGMGLRFDQLAPESQQNHQQILAAKARRGDRLAGTPAQGFAAAGPPARTAAKPATPPPIAARPAPVAAVAAPPSARVASEPSDEFGAGGKTEIADRPPSFLLDSLDSARGAGAGARQEAAPAAPLDDVETDSQSVAATDSSRSEPIDISEDTSAAVSSSGSAAAQAAADQRGGAESTGDELAPATIDLPLAGGTSPIVDLVPPSEQRPSATAGDANTSALPGKPVPEQSWLHRTMNMPEAASAAPVGTTSAERTLEVAAPPEAMKTVAAARASGEAQRPVLQTEVRGQDADPKLLLLASAYNMVLQAEVRGQDADLASERPPGQGKKLVVVGIVAAGLAFAGVYLLQVKPWQSTVAPAPRPSTAVPAPPPVAPPAMPELGQPSRPAIQPTAAKAEPVKPAVPTPKPAEAPAKTNPKVNEAAKPDVTAEAAKPRGPVVGSAKKTASKPAPSPPPALSPPPSSPAPAGQDETVYLLKVRSVPSGAQVLIDSEPMGQTPFQRRILDVDKNHTVTIRKPDYDPYEHIVAPSDAWVREGNMETMKVTAKLKRSKGPAATPEAQPERAPEQPEKL
jgi:uncharacterized protein (TIGR02266 family)